MPSLAPAQPLVLGLGHTGYGLALYLKKNGQQPVVVDTRETPPFLQKLQQLHPDIAVYTDNSFKPGKHNISDCYISPGFPLNHPLLKKLKQQKITLTNDIDIFANSCQGKILAVTGTNGKSTVCNALYQCLKKDGKSVALTGNFGTPVLEFIDSNEDYYILELSSFQLLHQTQLHSHYGCILNIAEDHLDQHGDMNNYILAKQNIFTHSFAQICNVADSATYVSQPNKDSNNIWWFGFGEDLPEQLESSPIFSSDRFATIQNGYLCIGKNNILPLDSLAEFSQHDILNALAVVAILASAGLERAAAFLPEYVPLPHRCQYLGCKKGIHFINDSKATNPHAATSTIQSLGEKYSSLIIIAGGDAKGVNMDSFTQALLEHAKAVALLGKDKLAIAEACKSIQPFVAENLDDVFSYCLQKAEPGDCILLCPGCSSTDMFTNYKERGRIFTQLVENL